MPVAAIYGTVAAPKIYYIVTDAQNTPRRLVDSSMDAVVWAWVSNFKAIEALKLCKGVWCGTAKHRNREV